MSMFSNIPSLFARRKPQNAPAISAGMRIVFHQDTRGFGQHGVIIATHVDHALNKEPVRFTFPGINEAPDLTPELIQYIWYKAEVEGFIVHSLKSYGSVMDSVKATKMSDVLSKPRQEAESRFPIQTSQQKLPAHVAQYYGQQLTAIGEGVLHEDLTNAQANTAIAAASAMAPAARAPVANARDEQNTSVMA